ncbi:MAG: hypothetical protein F6K31_36970 [Symploca sp. SIO2G7]|nr:hypothetical protein [Symploca sp. SIO2G7]
MSRKKELAPRGRQCVKAILAVLVVALLAVWTPEASAVELQVLECTEVNQETQSIVRAVDGRQGTRLCDFDNEEYEDLFVPPTYAINDPNVEDSYQGNYTVCNIGGGGVRRLIEVTHVQARVLDQDCLTADIE